LRLFIFPKPEVLLFISNCWEANDGACRYITGVKDQIPNQNTLVKANENLNLFYAVLSFDNFHEDVVQFLAKHELKSRHIPHERKHQYVAPTKEERAMIASYNK